MSRKNLKKSVRGQKRNFTLETLEDRRVFTGVHPLSDVPEFHSNPGAPVSLYLDFNGNHEDLWGGFINVNTPAFNLPGDDPATFSDEELDAMTSLWERVAEDYAPFNVDVTTESPDAQVLAKTRERLDGVVKGFGDVLKSVAPGDQAAIDQALASLNIPGALSKAVQSWDGVATRVAIGGSANDWFDSQWFGWFGDERGGVALGDSFNNELLNNTAFLFSDTEISQNGGVDLAMIADGISHEAGHTFGLNHQGEYDSGGVWHEYGDNQGDPNVAPIMGNYRGASRSIWWEGFTDRDQAPNHAQNDVAVLTRVLGARTDDHSDFARPRTVNGVLQQPTPLTTAGNDQVGAGIIGTVQDGDFFSFTATGPIDVRVSVPKENPNLDTYVELQDASGNVLASKSAKDTKLGAVLSFNPGLNAAGATVTQEYRLLVKSRGAHIGDLGQYEVKVTPTGGPRIIESQTKASRDHIQITFDKPININALRRNIGIVGITGPTTATTVTAVPGTGGMTFNVAFRPFATGGYRLIVTSGVTDLNGRTMNQDGDKLNGETNGDDNYTWSDLVAPTLTREPALHSNRKIALQFSEPIDPASLVNSISVTDARGFRVAVLGVTPVANSTTAFEVELSRFPQGGYTISLSGAISDVVGNRLTPETRTHLDNTGPMFQSIPLSAPGFVQVSFDESVDPATFTAADVKVVNLANNQTMSVTDVRAVAGTDSRSFYVIFNGGVGNYRITIGPNVLDLYGNRMSAAKTLNFRLDYWHIAERVPSPEFFRELRRMDTLTDRIPPELFEIGMRDGAVVRGSAPKLQPIAENLSTQLQKGLQQKGVDLKSLDQFFAQYETQEAGWSTLLKTLARPKSK